MLNTKELNQRHCHCGTNNRAPRWTLTDPCKPELRPGAREESASPACPAAPATNTRDTTNVYIWRLETGCGPTLYRKCSSHNAPGKDIITLDLTPSRGTVLRTPHGKGNECDKNVKYKRTSSIFPCWAALYLNSNLIVFAFLSWLDLLGGVRSFWISILQIFISHQNYRITITDTTSFAKHLGISWIYTLSFCPKLVQFRFRNMFLQEFLTGLLLWSSVPNSYQIRSEIRLVRRRKYDPVHVIIDRTIGFVLVLPEALYRSILTHCTLTKTALETIWSDLSKPP